MPNISYPLDPEEKKRREKEIERYRKKGGVGPHPIVKHHMKAQKLAKKVAKMAGNIALKAKIAR